MRSDRLITNIWLALGTLLLSEMVLGQTAQAKYDDGARYAFSASAEQSAVFVIDLRNREVTDTIALPESPDALVASAKLKALIIAHAQKKQLTLVDLSTERLTQIAYPLQITPNQLVVSPPGDSIAVYDSTARILEIHAVKRKVVLLHLERVNTNSDFTFNLDGSVLYWTDHIAGQLRSVDLWSTQKSLKLSGDGAGLSALSRSSDGRLGFISDANRNLVNVVELKSFRRIAEVPVGAQPGRPWGTADGQIIMVANALDNSVTAISTLHLQELYTVRSTGKAVSINSGWLDSVMAIVAENGKITFVETASGKVIKALQIGAPAREGVVTADSKTLAVSTEGGMSFFDMRKTELRGSVSQLPTDASEAELAISNNLCH